MSEAGVGRVLVASLHQAIADLLPTRLSFYENWLNAEGLREGTIGSHLENLERREGFKGFNQQAVSAIISATDPRLH